MTDEKTNSEIWKLWMEDDIDSFSLDELKRLERLTAIKGKRVENAVKEPQSLMPKEGEKKNTFADDDTNDLVEWAVQNSLLGYEELWANADSDAACPDDYADWTPTEFFSSYILSGVATNCDLVSLCKVKVDLGAGKGDKVVFRTTTTRTAQGDLGGCDCISCASLGWGKEEVTVVRFADNNIICEFDAWKALGTKEAELYEMKRGAERHIDNEIFDAVDESTPGFNQDLAVAMQCGDKYPTGSCCSVATGLYVYTALIDLLAAMHAGNYEPDALLIHPTVASFFKYKDAIDIPFMLRGNFEVDSTGRLSKLAGLKCVECNRMTGCSLATGQVLIYAIQSDRSVGLVWGQEPKFYEIYDGKCDSWSIGYNAYFGVDSLDDNSIGTVSNP